MTPRPEHLGSATGSETPTPLYRTIVADPPWPYGRANDPTYGTGVNPRRHIQKHGTKPLPYQEMSLQEIESLPIPDLAEVHAHLYLWTTQRHVEHALAISHAWGFRRSALLVWAKSPTGWNPAGTFMNSTEFVVFARRGSLKSIGRCDRQWWNWPRGAHSSKPEAFQDIVESVSPGPYLELFDRRNRLGCDTWGNEALNHVALDTGAEGPLALERTQ